MPGFACASVEDEQTHELLRLCRGMRPQDAPSDIGFMTLGGKSSISEVRSLEILNVDLST